MSSSSWWLPLKRVLGLPPSKTSLAQCMGGGGATAIGSKANPDEYEVWLESSVCEELDVYVGDNGGASGAAGGNPLFE